MLSVFILLSITIVLSDQKAFAGTDLIPPTGTIEYNSGDTYANTGLSLTLSCSDGSGSGCNSAILQIIDSNANLDSDDQDTFSAQVTFTSNPTDYGATFVETGDDTAIFQLSIDLTPGVYSYTNNDIITVVYTAIGEGTKTAQVTFSDVDTNYSTLESDSIIVDTTKPITTINEAGIVPLVAPGAFTGSDSISIPFTASDGTGSGVAYSECRLDSTEEEDYEECLSPVIYSTLIDGSHTVEIRSTDNVDNVESTDTFTWSVDTTPPNVSFVINGDDLGTFDRPVDLDMTCDDDVLLGIIGSGCGDIVIAGASLSSGTGTFPFSTQKQATLTEFRGLKAAEVTFEDAVGNSVLPITDDIALDARIVGITVTDDTPYWDVDVTFDGTVNNALPTDTITFDFGSPNILGLVIAGGDTSIFSVTDSYPQISLETDDNPHEPSATLVDSGSAVVTDSTLADVTTLGPIVTVQAHPTAITPDPFDNPNEGNRFFTGGILSDTLFSVPVTGKLISFTGAGASTDPDLPNYTTEGITFSDAGGIEIDSCSTVVVCPTPDNIMRLAVGATISPAEKTTYVGLHLRDMSSGIVTVRVTNGESPPIITDYTATASPTDTVLFTLSEPFEIETIEIISVSGSSTVGLSEVKTYGTELGTIHDIDFTTQTSGETSMTFDEGRFYSEGTAQSTAQESLDLDQVFAGDVDYVDTSSTVTYSVLESTTSGVGGAATVIADSGKGVTSVLCTNDGDNDSLCDAWEGGAGFGVPFVVGANSYLYPLPGTSNGVKDLLVEIDSQAFHIPDTTALANVVTTFAAEGVNLIHSVNDVTLTHVNPIKLWTDTDTIDNNDFNSLKNDWFGTSTERPTISGQTSQTYAVSPGATAATAHTITLSGITLSIPTNTITTGGETQGKIIATMKVTTKAGATATTTTVTPGTIAAPANPAGITLGTITAASATTATTGVKLLTVTIPFTTAGPIATTGIPSISIPITLGSSLTAAVTTNPGSPQIFTTLLDAKAQAYRYGIWAHSYGTTSSTPSGQSELLGNDFAVTLGIGYGGTASGHTGSIGTTNEQSGTYAHELGHILNLKHGGADDINCKPNYFSIMSYSRQLATYLGGAWTLSFSPGGHSPLTETALVESAANILGGTASQTAVYASPIISPATPTHAAPDHTFHTVAGNAATIDWNDSGTIGTTGSVDINNFGITGCGVTTPTATPYTDFDDSTLMTFGFRSAPSGQLDGISIFESDADGSVRYQTILASGTFDGLDSPVPNHKTKRGSNVPIKLDVTIGTTGVVDLPSIHGEVWVSAVNNVNGPYTRLTNAATGGTDVQWNPVTRQITFDWKTPSNAALGTYYLRVFLIDSEGGFVGGLGAPFPIVGPSPAGFLVDTVAPFRLPAGTPATDKVTLTK
jgi:hypothetical protein